MIVGGACAGLTTVSTLTSQSSQLFDITLVEKKDFVEATIYALRMMVQPNEFESSHIPLADLEHRYRRNGHRLQFLTNAEAIGWQCHDGANSSGTVTVINQNGVQQSIEYDYLVLAAGSKYATPYVKPDPRNLVSREMRRLEFQSFQQQVHSSSNRHVVVVGGGSLGLELVGELVDWNREHRPSNPFKITLVHSRTLLKDSSNSESMHQYLMSFMERNSVRVILGHRASLQAEEATTLAITAETAATSGDNDGEHQNDHVPVVPSWERDVDPTVTKTLALVPNAKLVPNAVSNSNNTVINDATMVFWCGSLRPCTEWLSSSGGSHNTSGRTIALNDSGFVKVNSYLQCEGHENIFAVGDINDAPCVKLMGAARVQAEKAARNIVRLAGNRTVNNQFRGKAISSYSLSLGSTDAYFSVGDYMVLWGAPAATLKSSRSKTNLLSRLQRS